MKVLNLIKKGLDRLLLFTSITMLTVMVTVIIVQVFSRQIFSYTPSWSEELSRVLFVWVSFLGICYGFKEKLHIGVGLVVNLMPEKVQDAFDLFSKVLVIILGFIMIYYGWQFTSLMHQNSMPGLRVPSSFLYVVIPITGFYIVIYGIELLFKKGMHQTFDELSEE